MAMMMSSLYDAPRSAGAGDGSARKAAEDIAARDEKFSKINVELAGVKWMIGFNIVLTAAVLGKLLV